jgi:regulator of sigma E protease
MLTFVHSALTYILPFLFVLTLVVTVHELGHFLAAKSFGVAIDRFAIGFGRSIAAWTDRSGVEWCIGWAPLGGYVRFSGDENAASVPDEKDLATLRREIESREGAAAVSRYFQFKPIWQRAVVTAAGPFANFGLAIVLFAALLFAFGKPITPARVDVVTPGSAAERAGFKAGDVVLKAAGQKIESFFDLKQIVAMRANAPTAFEIDRSGQILEIEATPVRQSSTDQFGGIQKVGALGLQNSPRPGDLTIKHYGLVAALAGGVQRTVGVLNTTVYYLGRLVQGQESADQLGGPLRIAQASGQVAHAGAEGAPDAGLKFLGAFVALLELAAVLSVGIGFMNLLPVPVLDGGHLLFYAYEAVARRPLAAKVQAAGYRVGLALLLGLMLFATWNDLQQLRVFKILGGLLS